MEFLTAQSSERTMPPALCYICPSGKMSVRGTFRMHTNPFAIEAAQYAHLRPTYPESLFAFLLTTVTSREVAWDCATGNGQVATHLARYFGRVIATDESAEMAVEVALNHAGPVQLRAEHLPRAPVTVQRNSTLVPTRTPGLVTGPLVRWFRCLRRPSACPWRWQDLPSLPRSLWPRGFLPNRRRRTCPPSASQLGNA